MLGRCVKCLISTVLNLWKLYINLNNLSKLAFKIEFKSQSYHLCKVGYEIHLNECGIMDMNLVIQISPYEI